VAKRPKSKKTARRAPRPSRARKTAKRRPRASSAPTGPRNNLPLKDLRLELDAAVRKWEKRLDEPLVARAVVMFRQWQTDIGLICDTANSPCGPTMDPLA
jgi:hypothetical protein